MARDRREAGQGLVEYALLIMLIALIALAAVMVFGQRVSTLYSQVVSGFP